MKKITLAATLLLTCSLLSGCLGQNALFNNFQNWNAHASRDRGVNQVISFAFWIIPIYELTLLGDLIIFNSIEFWSGRNPVSNRPAIALNTDNPNRTVTDGLGNQADLALQADGSIAVTEHSNGATYHYVLRETDGRVTLEGQSPSLAAF
ncbi:MAG TPA: DUF3332 family protein [Pseudomonadales bacterium]|jgi:hypothetical protein